MREGGTNAIEQILTEASICCVPPASSSGIFFSFTSAGSIVCSSSCAVLWTVFFLELPEFFKLAEKFTVDVLRFGRDYLLTSRSYSDITSFGAFK